MADALPADVLLVPVDGVPFGLYEVSAGDAGVTRTPVTSLDQTRQLADITLDGATGQLIASGEAAERAISAALTAGAAILAAEQLGTAERCLEMTVAYVKERHQFARPVGSFQAIKHRLADLWVAVTQARAASRYAAACLAERGSGCAGRGRAGQGRLLGRGGAGRPGVRAAARWHRLHLGAPGAPVPEAGQERVDRVRHRGLAPRVAGQPGQPARAGRGRRPVKSVDGAGVVVTGAGSGIGAALARRFAAEGARVVVNDINAEAAAAVAGSCGATAIAGDAASEDGVAALISGARSELGEIDMFCANAGVARAGGPESHEADWDACWQVNVMAHVRAARLLIGPWLERGEGHLICTVSAAGLLSMPGSAPYSVTKHAALAFAEWLALTYAHRGLTVQAICPQGVRTPMLAGSGAAAEQLLFDSAIEPEAVADATIAGIADGRFLILPHPEVAGMYAGRAAETDRWLRGMNRLQQGLEAAQ